MAEHDVWPEVPISEIAIAIKDGSHGTHLRSEGGVPLLSAKNVAETGQLEWGPEDSHVSEVEFALITAGFSPQEGDLLLTIVGTLGRRAIFDGSRVAFQRSVAFIRPDRRKVLTGYLFQATGSEHFLRQLVRRSKATAQAGLYLGELAKATIPLPPKDQQEAIYSVLGAIDHTIQCTRTSIAKFERIKAGVMRDLFTRGLDSNGNLRDSRESRATRYGIIPPHWKIGTALDVTDRSRQPILTGPFGADLGDEDFVPEGVPILRIGNVQQGELDLTDLLFVSEAKAHQLHRYRINEGDLLFARQGATTGRNALASADVSSWLINYHIIRIALDHEKCAPLFIEGAFNSEVVKRQIERDKGRGTREGINTDQLTHLQLPMPDIDEQREIARIINGHSLQVKALHDQADKLRRMKIGLSSSLLAGTIQIPVDTQIGEPADV